MRLQTGSRLGPYEITGAIGAGGMGEVYRARDTRLRREVAIKVLPHDLTRDEERLARFEREARSASALNHRNIITIHDFSSHDGETWLVMELIHGESLRDITRRGALPLKKVLSIASGVADGLAVAHAAGIVHRDLKPENVMVTGDGTPKILDFGLVKQIAAKTDPNSPTEVQMSHSGMIIGTTSYMSPEQARGEPVDHRTDQFALGLMLYELAAGKHPFRRATAAETFAAIFNDEPEPLSDSLPDAFADIVNRCLAKSPDERYGSTADLAHDLRRLRDAPSRSLASPRRARSAPWWPIAGAIAISVIATAGWMTWRARTPPRGDPIHTTIATPEVANVHRSEVTMPVALSPDGRYLAVLGVGLAGGNVLALHDLHAGTFRLLAENALGVGWAPDSKAVAFFADGKLKTAALDGSPARIVCDALPEGPPAWHGDTILFTQFSKAPGLYRVRSSGGTPQRIATAPGLSWWPQFLSDGNRFLYLMLLPAPGKLIGHKLMLGSLDGAPHRIVSDDIDSRVVLVDGTLLFVRDGVLLAQSFDADEARLSGEAKPLVGGLHYFRSTGSAAFSASDNGLLAWCSTRPPVRLVWLDRLGFEIGSIGSGAFTDDGRISPDGSRYAVGKVDAKQGTADVWSFDLARGSAERVTFRGLDERAPVWAADAKTIYYQSDGGGGPPDIRRLRLGEDDATWLHRGPAVEEPQDASRDGKWLLFINDTLTGTADLHVLPLDPPGPPRPFVTTPFNERSPRFSPDGRFVAYQSDASGRAEVYVRRFEGTPETLRVSQDGGIRPQWARHGRELYYLGPAGRLMAVAMSDDGAPSTPRALFQAAGAIDFDVAHDGSRFLVQLEERSAEPPVHLLINWPALLRER